MVSADTAQIDHDLECQSALARDAIVSLYPATQYAQTTAFATFGRPVVKAAVLGNQPVRLHLAGEAFAVVLPHAFTVTFRQGGRPNGKVDQS